MAQHAGIGRIKIPAQVHHGLEIVIAIRDGRGIGGEPDDVGRFIGDIACQDGDVIRRVGPDVFVVETERMAHLVADLRPAQAGDGDDLRAATSAGHVVNKVGIVGEKNPVRLVGVRNKFDLGGQLPFAQAVEIRHLLSGGQRVRKFIRHDAAGPGNVASAKCRRKNFRRKPGRPPAAKARKPSQKKPGRASGKKHDFGKRLLIASRLLTYKRRE